MAKDGNYIAFFRLGGDERIVNYLKPLPALKIMLFLQNLFVFAVVFFFIGFFLPFVAIAAMHGSGGALTLIFGIIGFVILVLLLAYATAQLQYDKADYWLTNKRVVVKKGFIGYQVSSIPFERISDVIITRSFWEKLFGVGGLFIQSLAGQITYPNRMGAEGAMPAVPDPERTQELIFKLIKEKRKEEKLTM